MKIFISHSSKNKNFGNTLVELLRNVGIKENEIIYTSNIAYGIPVGQNIFNWLKSQISEKPFVIYLLSEEYYESIACLNEMGAAWIVENEHAAIFTPNFNLSSKEFQSGALDPREIGFYLNDEDRIYSFIQLLRSNFEITQNSLIITQSVKKFIGEVGQVKPNTQTKELIKPSEIVKEADKRSTIISPIPKIKIEQTQSNNGDLYSKFIKLITDRKIKDDELLLLHYMVETGRVKLTTGWQESTEVSNIKEWEKLNDIKDILSQKYAGVLQRLELRGFTEVSAVTGSGNPKEVKLKDEIATNIHDLPIEVLDIVDEVVKRNYFEHSEESESEFNFQF